MAATRAERDPLTGLCGGRPLRDHRLPDTSDLISAGRRRFQSRVGYERTRFTEDRRREAIAGLGAIGDGNTVHTGQLFFDERTTATVYSKGVYAADGAQDTTNATDGIFSASGGKSTLKLSRRRNKKGRKIDGYLGQLKLGVTRA